MGNIGFEVVSGELIAAHIIHLLPKLCFLQGHGHTDTNFLFGGSKLPTDPKPCFPNYASMLCLLRMCCQGFIDKLNAKTDCENAICSHTLTWFENGWQTLAGSEELVLRTGQGNLRRDPTQTFTTGHRQSAACKLLRKSTCCPSQSSGRGGLGGAWLLSFLILALIRGQSVRLT